MGSSPGKEKLEINKFMVDNRNCKIKEKKTRHDVGRGRSTIIKLGKR